MPNYPTVTERSPRRIAPRIEHRRAGLLIVAHIAGYDRQTVMERRCGDDQIGLRESMAGFAAVFDQEPPLEHDVFGDCEHSLFEHRPHLVRKPIIQFGATGGAAGALDAKPDFGQRHRADVEKIERLRGDEGEDLRLWLGTAQFGQDVGIK